MARQKRWRVKKTDPVLKTILSKELHISPVVAQLLINRGIYTVDAARNFLSGDIKDINPPELMQDMDKAVDRISRALKYREKILVYGDYDADGITATTLLVNVLRRLGGTVNYFVPHRVNEGYGLHLKALKRAKETGHTLVVTVDCGISDCDTVAQNNSCGGPDIIITDHHEPPETLPPAFAILNPKRRDCNYPFKELAGVGVALKLVQALEKVTGGGVSWREFLDLVCVGTIADVVALQGENRILVKNGLPVLASTTNLGLQALMHVSSVKAENLDTRQVAFAMAPRLNAAGRLGDARLAIDLLLADNYAEAWELASQLNSGNQQRQKVESMVLAEAIDMIESTPGLAADKVLVLGAESWHPGVIGIVASRLLERFYRPVLLVALDGETGKGSARSIPGFHMYQALEKCRDKLTGYGGHALAAGFSLPSKELDAFREEINSYAESILTPEIMTPGIELDAVISLEDINEELVNQLDSLWPYGQGNPRPLFACHDVSLLNCRGVGKEGAHLKMLVKEGRVTIDGIGFNLGSHAEVVATREVDLAFIPTINEWNGNRLLQLDVKEIQPADAGLYDDQDRQLAHPDKKTSEVMQCTHLQTQQEMFLPGFLTKVLARCAIIEGYAGYSGDYLDNGASVMHPVEVIDRRNYPGRNEVLCSFNSEKKTVVVVNCPYQSLELFSFLTRCGIISSGEALLNPLLYDNSRDMIESEFKTGHVKMILSTPQLLSLPEDFRADNVVFYNIPYHPSEFYNLLACCNASRAYLLYNMEDGEVSAEYLRAMAPGRELMAGFYNCLRAFDRAGRSWFVKQHVIEIMAANGFPGVREFSISIALKVFKELQLLDFKGNNEIRFELFPAPEHKLSLDESPTYRYLQETRAACANWQHLAMKTDDPLKLLKFDEKRF